MMSCFKIGYWTAVVAVSFDAILNNNTIPLLLYDADEEQIVAARNLPDNQDIDALNKGGRSDIESYLDEEFRFVFTDMDGKTHDTLFQDVVYLGSSGKYQILYQSYSSAFKRFVAFINNRLKRLSRGNRGKCGVSHFSGR